MRASLYWKVYPYNKLFRKEIGFPVFLHLFRECSFPLTISLESSDFASLVQQETKVVL